MRKLAEVSLVVALMAGSAVAAADSSIAGTWQGKMGDVSVVTLTVKDDDGKLGGTAIFYKVVDNGSGPRVVGKSSTDMIDAKLEGKVFSFQTKGPQGELSSYQMELTGKNEGKFKGTATVTGGGDAPEIRMIRE